MSRSLFSLLSSAMLAAPVFAATPNIVVIYADDLGFGDISCQGATAVSTPNIDRIASEGLRFTDAHSSAPTCTPSRFSLLTGQYAWRTPGTGVAAGDAALLIRPGTVTLPSMLRQAGYATACIGKWHLGLGTGTTDFNAEIRPGPLELGFDHFFGMPATVDRVPCVYVENRHVFRLHPEITNAGPIQVSYGAKVGDDPTQEEIPAGDLNATALLRPIAPYLAPGGRVTYQADAQHAKTIIDGISRIGYMDGGEDARWDDDDIAAQLVAKAGAFITAKAAAAQPFFLYYSAHDIHVPRVPNSQFIGTSAHGIRGDAIHQLDWQVGRLLARLEDPNGDGDTSDSTLDDTLVIFTSDNGPVLGDGYHDGAAANPGSHDINGPHKNGKYSVNEGGHRIPFLVRWPGHVPAGAVTPALISQTDLLATLAALVDQPLPTDAGPDSESLLPALLGQTPAGRQHLVNQNNSTAKAIRQGDLKYFFDDALFYHLGSDPGESTNVLGSNNATATAMKATFDEIAATPMTSPVLAWWPCDDGSGSSAREFSSAKHTATLAGGPAWLTDAGRPFLRFDGTGQAATAGTLTGLAGAFTVTLWARSAGPAWNASSCLLAHRPQFALQTAAGTRGLDFVVVTGGTPRTLSLDLATLPGFDLTAWHHYAVTYDASRSSAEWFVDGVRRASTTFPAAALDAGSGPVRFASDADGSNLACDLSDLRVHPLKLTPQRIANAASVRLSESDGDGIYDDWEMLYQLDPFDASDGSADADNDGASNRTEFDANSDPKAAPAASTPHALIDFGRTGLPSGPTANGPVYNNLSFATIPRTAWNATDFTPAAVSMDGGAAVASADLIDTTGGSPAWTISFGGKYQTATGANVLFTPGTAAAYGGTIPSSALETFLINGTTATGAANTALNDQITLQNGGILRVTIAGLDDQKRYDVTAFSGRGNAFNFTDGKWALVTGTATEARFQDAAGTFVANTGQGIDADGNAGKAVLWHGVQPAGGAIAFDIVSPDNTSTVDLNGLSIRQLDGTPASHYDLWLDSHGLTAGAAGTGPLESHDGSGVANLVQFALGGDPVDPSDNGVRVVTPGDGNGAVLTIAALAGATFADTPSPQATLGGITYTIQGGSDLATWTSEVVEILPALDHGGQLVAPPGYSLHSFRLANTSAGPRGFLRAGIAPAP